MDLTHTRMHQLICSFSSGCLWELSHVFQVVSAPPSDPIHPRTTMIIIIIIIYPVVTSAKCIAHEWLEGLLNITQPDDPVDRYIPDLNPQITWVACVPKVTPEKSVVFLLGVNLIIEWSPPSTCASFPPPPVYQRISYSTYMSDTASTRWTPWSCSWPRNKCPRDRRVPPSLATSCGKRTSGHRPEIN